MMRRLVRWVPAMTLGLTLFVPACAPAEDEGATSGEPANTAEAAAETEGPTREVAETEEDWVIFRDKIAWALEERLDTLPLGDLMARLAESFVGTKYTPRTLEIPGEEQLVLNFEEFDCVTLVENVLALGRFLHSAPPTVMTQARVYQNYYKGILANIRYRDGRVDGYPSRLHYFSEWITENDRRGLIRNITSEIGGVVDPEPITFMSRHADLYRQLGEGENLGAIEQMESRINQGERFYIPEGEIAALSSEIRNGDIIAATSTVEGLDIAHTGIAAWIDGELHLIHAPLVGKDVQISQRTLAQRIVEMKGQDGIMVARPIDPRTPAN